MSQHTSIRYEDPNRSRPLRALPFIALRQTLRENYSRANLRGDILAGLVVGVVALPLSMALAIAVNAPPQQGLYTAIVAGFVVALLGGSRCQVTGPTAAFIPILLPICLNYGLGGLLMAGILGGVILVAMGLLRLGRLIEYIPHPVTTGFTAGIATVIGTLQLKDLFGLQMAKNNDHFLERVHDMWTVRGSASGWEFLIGIGTLAILVFFPRFVTRRVPAPLVALPVAALAAWLLAKYVPAFHVTTIAAKFHTTVNGHVVDGIPQIPPLPTWPWNLGGPKGQAFHFSFDVLQGILPGAFAVAMLGAIESLLSAVVADGMAGTKHDPDAELLALGIGNIVCPFFGGIPATGAIARTATNIRSGGRSPLSAMVHAVTVLAAVLALAPLIGYLPMSALAALLMLVAWNMSELKHFIHILRVAPRNDVAVLLVCYGLTVVVDMVYGVYYGVLLAALLFMRRMIRLTRTRILSGAHPELPRPVPDGVFVYHIGGPLFFGAAQKAMATLRVIADQARVVILRMEEVPDMDATGLVALESALERLERQKIAIVLEGVQRQPRKLMRDGHLKDKFKTLRIRPDMESALQLAEEILARRAAAGGSTKIRLQPPHAPA
ncbi:MAG: C4-dicarboxylic acid transporter DauA [Planctomycetes bacterium]|nr:C4-dicarboxylic acid transporter DauA [Planctomycetota bacterium]